MTDGSQKMIPSEGAAARVPDVPFGFLPRKRASARFQEIFARYRAILIVAPNGYGKTAFLAHELASSHDPVAWFPIDERTSSPATFHRALVACIGQVVPAVKEALASQDSHDVDAYLSLVDAVASMAPRICIVLDGYEHIQSDEVDVCVESLMNYLPDTAHVILVSSAYPHLGINRMVLKGFLSEMKIADLTFDADETIALFNEVLDLDLPLGAIERICEYMDGWAAGLRMAEVALRSGADVESILSSGSESQRSISAYLTDDIVDRQSEEVRTFLLESSLFDSFCADLCDRAFDRTDSRAIMQRILEDDLFLQPAGMSGWYRYANFFRHCLGDLAACIPDERRRRVHRQASTWFAEHALFEEALEQAIDADDYDQVVSLLNDDYATMMGKDVSVKMDALIRKLPESIVRRSLWTNIGAAVACEMQQCFVQEDAYVRAALAHARDEGTSGASDVERNPTLWASLHIMRMLDAYHRGEPGTVLGIGQAWLDEGLADQRGRCGILNVMGMAHWFAGDLASAHSCWQESANLATYIGWPYSICLNLFGVAHVHYLRGDLDSAAETCQHIFAISNCQDRPVLSSGYAHMLMAKVLYDRNELDKASTEVEIARHIAEEGSERSLVMQAEMALARIEVAQGATGSAVERANRCLSAFCANPQYRQSFEEAHILMAQVWLLAGKPDMAGDYMRHLKDSDVTRSDEGEYVHDVLSHSVFGGDFRNVWGEAPLFDYLYCLIEAGRTEDVMPWADHVKEEAGARGIGLLVSQALIVKALCSSADKDVDRALGWLAESLVLAEQEGNVRIYLDAGEPMERLLTMARRKRLASRFCDRLIAQFAAGRATPGQVTTDFGQTFTRREREIMRLLCSGATNEEIAKRFYVSLSTVKNHIHSIYTKLGVRNRAEAIVRLQELGFSD